ncbi:MAG: NAD(P)/FAD-dependent oxidoreductase [Anaerolineae bacterium]|nr:NAD(P)/FAD-dependent oxidoreductase [Anaerolineae bacterium]MBL8104475.1 NAD(P)/FAD-dependent oxidoreductase [Anaerolineales bacterium]MCC7187186.1 NAD(P)/FAD-dependent oxidoreductase [Anaerolineales bacterium]
MKTDWDVIVVGGGPAGFFAAIRCAELNPSLNVLILEKATQTLGKVIVSGGGRCNVTHACFDPARLVAFYPRGGNELRGAFARFQPRDTIAWFETRGVKLKTEADGRIFPVTDDSNTIADCLRSAAKSAGVEVWGHSRLGRVDRNQDESFQLTTQTLRDVFTRLRAGKLLLATGSDRKTLAIVKLLGHTVVDPVPSLFTFNVRDERIKGLEGVSVASVSLKMDSLSTQGALLITHWGLSGPAVLRLSAWGAREFYGMNYRAELTINWLDNYSFDKALDVLQRNKAWKENARKKLSSHAAFSQIPARLWKRLVDFIGDKNWADVSKEEVRKLAKELTAGTFTIQSKGVFKEEFVTCGGVNLKEVDFKTMQSRIVKGLFFAGEVLDIDGVTGGFNFQSSWTTGWIAGSAMGAPG